jgi:hypothetical protein
MSEHEHDTEHPRIQLKMSITATLLYSSAWHESAEEREWFMRKVLQGEHLIVYSPLMSKPIGTLRVLTTLPVVPAP